MTVCPECLHVHTSRDAYALWRFNPERHAAFHAVYPGAPFRPTRALAEADMCAHRKENLVP